MVLSDDRRRKSTGTKTVDSWRDYHWLLSIVVKIPNITAPSQISSGTILTNIFAKWKSFLFSYCVNYDKKASEWYYLITGGENLQGQKLLIAEETYQWLLSIVVKIPNITAPSQISSGTILTNIFAKWKSFLFSYFVNLDKKASEWYYLITGGENLQGQKLLIAEETIIDCYL